jgi:hypothetical protein
VDALIQRAEVALRLAERSPTRLQLDSAEAADLPPPETLRRSELEAQPAYVMAAEGVDDEPVRSPILPWPQARLPQPAIETAAPVFDLPARPEPAKPQVSDWRLIPANELPQEDAAMLESLSEPPALTSSATYTHGVQAEASDAEQPVVAKPVAPERDETPAFLPAPQPRFVLSAATSEALDATMTELSRRLNESLELIGKMKAGSTRHAA